MPMYGVKDLFKSHIMSVIDSKHMTGEPGVNAAAAAKGLRAAVVLSRSSFFFQFPLPHPSSLLPPSIAPLSPPQAYRLAQNKHALAGALSVAVAVSRIVELILVGERACELRKEVTGTGT